MIDETLDLPLEKLVLTPEGCEIFDILCLRLDVNQKYVDLLPQWRDVAHVLQLDDLATKWVEVCVRPREGLTRAMLEIYMRDGGTLGKYCIRFDSLVFICRMRVISTTNKHYLIEKF